MPIYIIDSAYGTGTTPGSVWQVQDISAITGVQAFSLFRQLYLTLSTQALAEPIHIDLTALQSVLGTNTDLLSDIFAAWSDVSLVTIASIPQFKAVHAVFSDAYRAGYSVQSSLPGSDYTSVSPELQRTEMQLSRKGTDMTYFTNHCLTTVNGYFYLNETDGKTTFVPHAGKSLFQSRQNQVGFLSFETIGTIKQIPITPAMVRPSVVGGNLCDRAYIDLPDIDLTNKSVLLVLAGHLHFLGDGNFWPVANNTFCLDTRSIPIKERFFESKHRMDYTSMGLTQWADAESIQLAEFFANPAMLGYITHEQSFFVVVDTPRLTKQRLHIKNFKRPGIFIAYREPKELLVTSTGRTAEYWKVFDDGEWLVSVEDSFRANRVFGSTPTENPNAMVSSNNLPYRTYFNSRAHLLDIIADQPI